MAGKAKKIDIFEMIHSQKEFDHVVSSNYSTLICAEIFCNFAGHCTALDRLFNTIKLDWSNGKIILLKVPADEIEALERFRNHSEPVFMFILKGKVTKVFRGVNNLKFAEVTKNELLLWNKEAEGIAVDRPLYEISQPTSEEMEWLTKCAMEKALESTCLAAKRADRQAARKRHRAELMVPHLQTLNFILFWPHCFHAHPELYERWDANNIIMVGREVLDLTEEVARDILYAGDAPLNEASLQKLLSGPALAICFRLLDTDKHFVTLVRKILYEDLPVYDDNKPADGQLPRVTAFDYYKTFSLSREEIWKNRREDRVRRKAEQIEQRARRLSEMQRMARQAIEDAIEAKKVQKENRRMELLKSGNLTALDHLDQESDEDEINIEIPQELPDEFVEEESDEEDENEYLPPAGLLIPGFYTPPNDVAKSNGLAVLFPKIVSDNVTPEDEFLPPHTLVMLEISKRHKAIEAISQYKSAIIHALGVSGLKAHGIFQNLSEPLIDVTRDQNTATYIGIFKATTPYDSEHIAYSVKQYDTMDISLNPAEVKLAFMLSVKSDVALLQLMDLNPVHVSRDVRRGEDECASMFPLDYADEYNEFEDFNDAA